MNVRLQKFLATNGIASRRKAEQMIARGDVSVNGVIVRKMGTTVDPETDHVEVEGAPVAKRRALVYYMVNKPRGILSAASDATGRKTVVSLVPDDTRVYPIGRLDLDSEGIVILTNDGDLAYEVMHPKFEHEKEYRVTVNRPLTEKDLTMLERGVHLDEGVARARGVTLVKPNCVNIVLTQGWKRQIRRMFKELGLTVTRLVRIRVGKLTLGTLLSGSYRKLGSRDLEKLRSS